MNRDELELTAEVLQLVDQMQSTQEYKDMVEKYPDQLYIKTLVSGDSTILVKCLQECKRDVNKSLAAFVKLMNWRVENQIDNCLDEWKFDVEGIKKYYPHQFQGYDEAGHPIYIERLGKIDIKNLGKVVTLEEFAKYHIYHHEYIQRVLLPKATEKAGHTVKQFVTVCDVGGIGLGQLSSKSVLDLLGKVAEIDQSYYPASGHRLYMVNAPWLFKAVWKIISPFIAARGRDKISVVYGDLTAAKSASEFNMANLPKFVGGKSADDVATDEELLYRDMIWGKQLFKDLVL